MSRRLRPDALPATKFAPARVPTGWVPRDRLTAMLEQGLQGPLTLLAAGAGAGKSAMLSAWHADRAPSLTVGWLSLDAADADPRRFWRGVFAALRRGGAGGPVAALDLHPAEDAALALPALINALDDATGPVVLVLDDLHELGDAPVVQELDRLLRHPPPALRIVASTRVDPALRLGRLRVDGAVTEIREAELAFTLAETAALLAAAGIELAPDDVATLWRRTEGWAAGLRLAALTLRRHPDPSRFVAAFAGDDAAMADYLLAEVLAQQPDELVDFLLRTSIVDLVSADLADALLERRGSEPLLAQLEREHALVTRLDGEEAWRRYHPLLRELLVSRLRHRQPEIVPELHRRAAHWYVARGRPVEAVRHATEADAWELVGALAAEHWLSLLLAGELTSLRAVLQRLPAARAHADPEIALALSAVLLGGGDHAAAAAFLDSATNGRGRVPAERRPQFAVGLRVARLLAARIGGDLAQARSGAAELLRRDGAAAALRALARINLGVTELSTGDVDAGAAELQAALRDAEDADSAWLRLVALAELSAAAVLDGRLGRAEQLALETLALADARGLARTWVAGLAATTLSAVAFQRNRLGEAEARFARGAELVALAPDVPLRVGAELHRARLLLARGGGEAALQAIERARELRGAWPVGPRLRGLEAELRARALAVTGRHDEACRELSDRPGTAEEAAALAHLRLLAGEPADALEAVGPWLDAGAHCAVPVRVELCLLGALAHDAQADHSGAAAALERALDAAEPGGLRRPFAIFGANVRVLLRRQVRFGTAHRSLVDDLLAELDRPAGDGAARALIAESLSDREAAVLRCLPTMMSNTEIAAELYVSVNTVKTHLKAIYRKLDVPDRREAVRRARELELLAP